MRHGSFHQVCWTRHWIGMANRCMRLHIFLLWQNSHMALLSNFVPFFFVFVVKIHVQVKKIVHTSHAKMKVPILFNYDVNKTRNHKSNHPSQFPGMQVFLLPLWTPSPCNIIWLATMTLGCPQVGADSTIIPKIFMLNKDINPNPSFPMCYLSTKLVITSKANEKFGNKAKLWQGLLNICSHCNDHAQLMCDVTKLIILPCTPWVFFGNHWFPLQHKKLNIGVAIHCPNQLFSHIWLGLLIILQ